MKTPVRLAALSVATMLVAAPLANATSNCDVKSEREAFLCESMTGYEQMAVTDELCEQLTPESEGYSFGTREVPLDWVYRLDCSYPASM